MAYRLFEGLAANISPFFSPGARLRPTFAWTPVFSGAQASYQSRRPWRKFSSAHCECDLTHANFSPILCVSLWVVVPSSSASGEFRRVQLEGSFLPEHCKTDWERRAAGMGRLSRKAE